MFSSVAYIEVLSRLYGTHCPSAMKIASGLVFCIAQSKSSWYILHESEAYFILTNSVSTNPMITAVKRKIAVFLKAPFANFSKPNAHIIANAGKAGKSILETENPTFAAYMKKRIR